MKPTGRWRRGAPAWAGQLKWGRIVRGLGMGAVAEASVVAR